MATGCVQNVTLQKTESLLLSVTYNQHILNILRVIYVTCVASDLRLSWHTRDTCKGFMVASPSLLKKVFNFDVLDLVDIEAKMLRVSKGWKCLDCDYEHIRKDLMLSHIQANHVDFPGYSCNICGKFSKTWVALNKHRTRNHKNKIPV